MIKHELDIGFIGAGNMGTAMIKSMIRSGDFNKNNIHVCEINKHAREQLANETGVLVYDDAAKVAAIAKIIFIAVKPYHMDGVLKSISEFVDKECIIVSVALGITISHIKSIIGDACKVIRTMPNTPALVGEGMTVVAYEVPVSEQDIEVVTSILKCFGLVEIMEERLMNEVTALTGSSPAYVYMFIEAMADAAVQSGIARATAYRLAAQAVLGSAKMVLDTGKHPGVLKDAVCSPAGSTIEAVYSLEKDGFRSSIMTAMEKCTNRAREISSGKK